VASRDGPNARAPSFGAAGLHPSPESTSSVLLLPGRCDGERRTRTRGRPDDRFRPAEDEAAIPIVVHTHPRMAPRPSDLDDTVDGLLCALAASRVGRPGYASIIGSL
jgi:hypothetical protein